MPVLCTCSSNKRSLEGILTYTVAYQSFTVNNFTPWRQIEYANKNSCMEQNKTLGDDSCSTRLAAKMSEKLGGFEFWRVKLKSAHLIVAPMVDQSECAWRMLSRRYSAELCYTPMFHASIFTKDTIYRREALASCEGDRPLIVQFCANDPDTLLRAAELAAPHCDAVDLNLGCPQSIAKRGHYGAFLQDEWGLIHDMVSLCHEKLSVPITCKIRVFESVEKTVKYAQMLEKAGCQLLTVHGRTREQKGRLTGVASWEHIKAVRESVGIPVFANGNVQYLADVDRCIQETGVHGVMTAEGNLHNPALFSGLDLPVWQMAEEYLRLVDLYPCPISYVRAHMFKLFIHALQIHQDIRMELGKGKSMDCFRLAVLKLKERCLADAKALKENPNHLKSDLPLPYWICQPYVRPSPEEARAKEERAREREKLKRPLASINTGDDQPLSKNKQKKQQKYPHKNFDPEKKFKFEKCETCNNPRGYKCVFSLCKNCCRDKTSTEILDCFGHNIFVKTRKERREQLEAKQREMAAKTEEYEEVLRGLTESRQPYLQPETADAIPATEEVT